MLIFGIRTISHTNVISGLSSDTKLWPRCTCIGETTLLPLLTLERADTLQFATVLAVPYCLTQTASLISITWMIPGAIWVGDSLVQMLSFNVYSILNELYLVSFFFFPFLGCYVTGLCLNFQDVNAINIRKEEKYWLYWYVNTIINHCQALGFDFRQMFHKWYTLWQVLVFLLTGEENYVNWNLL